MFLSIVKIFTYFLREIWLWSPDKYMCVFLWRQILSKSLVQCWGRWSKVSCGGPLLNVKKVREKQTGEEEDLEEKVFQEGSSLEQLRPLDLRSSARMLTPTLVRMLNHISPHICHCLIFSGRRRVSLLPGPPGREELARFSKRGKLWFLNFDFFSLRVMLQMMGSAPPLAGQATEKLAADIITSLLIDTNKTILSSQLLPSLVKLPGLGRLEAQLVEASPNLQLVPPDVHVTWLVGHYHITVMIDVTCLDLFFLEF